MTPDSCRTLLKRVSRSFYLSLRLLDPAVRPAISLAYLLARASDSIADASHAPIAARADLLRGLPDAFPVRSPLPADGLAPGEAELLDVLPSLLNELADAPDRDEILGLWRTILEGQLFDLERFISNPAKAPPLTPEELERYTYLVAGCVGEFWTRICLKHIADYSLLSCEEMLPLARRFGCGLQLVNILRDRKADQALGRVYVVDSDVAAQTTRAEEFLSDGFAYAQAVRPRLMRAACLLPADLGLRTLALLRTQPEGHRKVSRFTVWFCLAKALVDQQFARTT